MTNLKVSTPWIAYKDRFGQVGLVSIISINQTQALSMASIYLMLAMLQLKGEENFNIQYMKVQRLINQGYSY